MDDWHALWVEALRAIPGGRSIEDAGRFEVPLSGWTATEIERAVEGHGLKLSPPASRALSTARSAPQTPTQTAAGSDPGWLRRRDGGRWQPRRHPSRGRQFARTTHRRSAGRSQHGRRPLARAGNARGRAGTARDRRRARCARARPGEHALARAGAALDRPRLDRDGRRAGDHHLDPLGRPARAPHDPRWLDSAQRSPPRAPLGRERSCARRVADRGEGAHDDARDRRHDRVARSSARGVLDPRRRAGSRRRSRRPDPGGHRDLGRRRGRRLPSTPERARRPGRRRSSCLGLAARRARPIHPPAPGFDDPGGEPLRRAHDRIGRRQPAAARPLARGRCRSRRPESRRGAAAVPTGRRGLRARAPAGLPRRRAGSRQDDRGLGDPGGRRRVSRHRRHAGLAQAQLAAGDQDLAPGAPRREHLGSLAGQPRRCRDRRLQLRDRRRPARGPRRAPGSGPDPRRVPLRQEPVGGEDARRARARRPARTRRAPPPAHRHPGGQSAGGARQPASRARSPFRVRLAHDLQEALQHGQLAPAPPPGAAELLLPAPQEGGRARAAPGQAPRGGHRAAGQRGRVPVGRAQLHPLARGSARRGRVEPCQARRPGGGARSDDRAAQARRRGQAGRGARVDRRLPPVGGATRRLRPSPSDPGGGAASGFRRARGSRAPIRPRSGRRTSAGSRRTTGRACASARSRSARTASRSRRRPTSPSSSSAGRRRSTLRRRIASIGSVRSSG